VRFIHVQTRLLLHLSHQIKIQSVDTLMFQQIKYGYIRVKVVKHVMNIIQLSGYVVGIPKLKKP
jgi:hypothetical protein